MARDRNNTRRPKGAGGPKHGGPKNPSPGGPKHAGGPKKPGGKPGGPRPGKRFGGINHARPFSKPFQRHGGGDGERPSPEVMQKMLQKAGIELDDKALKRLWTFHNLLRERNHDRDLTRLIGFHTIVTRHYIDCMLVGKMYDLPSPILDVGTGAGFPGIPLLIQNPELTITLAEPRPRRVLFLKEAIQKLGFTKADVFDHKVVSRSFNKPVKAVITRALETMDKTCLRTSACLGVGGELILMKGPNADDELKETLKRFKNRFQLKLDNSYVLPGTTHDRRLIVLEKLTPPEIPQGADAASEEAEWDGDSDES